MSGTRQPHTPQRLSRGGLLVPLTLLLAVAAGCNPAATPTPVPPVVTTAPTATPAATANAASAPIALSVVSCADSTKQLCAPAAVVTVWTEGALTVDFTASPGHCSAMIAHVSLDDGAVTRVSEKLDPGVATGPIDLGPVAPGEHVVSIQAEGVVGGCNSGGVANWSGSIVFGISAGADPYPSPRLGTPGP